VIVGVTAATLQAPGPDALCRNILLGQFTVAAARALWRQANPNALEIVAATLRHRCKSTEEFAKPVTQPRADEEEPSLTNSYLDVARKVLLVARRPLTANEIFEEAILSTSVPSHLYGRTPHKTLHARLSEDILKNRQRSAFFRTSAGEFFLRELIHDRTIDDSHKQEYRAPRRMIRRREAPVLAFSKELWRSCFQKSTCVEIDHFRRAADDIRPNYISPQNLKDRDDYLPILSFLIAHREASVLSYVLGRLNVSEDPIENFRSIGFGGFVHESDQDISYESLLAIVESGVSMLSHGAGLSYELAEQARYSGALKP